MSPPLIVLRHVFPPLDHSIFPCFFRRDARDPSSGFFVFFSSFQGLTSSPTPTRFFPPLFQGFPCKISCPRCFGSPHTSFVRSFLMASRLFWWGFSALWSGRFFTRQWVRDNLGLCKKALNLFLYTPPRKAYLASMFGKQKKSLSSNFVSQANPFAGG